MKKVVTHITLLTIQLKQPLNKLARNVVITLQPTYKNTMLLSIEYYVFIIERA